MKRLLFVALLLAFVLPADAATIIVEIKVDSSINSQLQQVCNRMRVNRGYSSNGWTNRDECAQVIFNTGVEVVSREEATTDATAYSQTCFVDRTNQIMDPITSALALHDPPKVECGDSYVDGDAGEQCDDGNNVDGDGCQGNCLLPRCGDSIIDGFDPYFEECDDGNNFNNDGCDQFCKLES